MGGTLVPPLESVHRIFLPGFRGTLAASRFLGHRQSNAG
jgi:hypothetical protein